MEKSIEMVVEAVRHRQITPEERLIVAVIRSGILENDVDYINGDVFEYHCGLLGLDYEPIRRCFHEKQYNAKGNLIIEV